MSTDSAVRVREDATASLTTATSCGEEVRRETIEEECTILDYTIHNCSSYSGDFTPEYDTVYSYSYLCTPIPLPTYHTYSVHVRAMSPLLTITGTSR